MNTDEFDQRFPGISITLENYGCSWADQALADVRYTLGLPDDRDKMMKAINNDRRILHEMITEAVDGKEWTPPLIAPRKTGDDFRYVVVCKAEGAYVLTTRQAFSTAEAAKEYADTVDQSREPIVVLGRFYNLWQKRG